MLLPVLLAFQVAVSGNATTYRTEIRPRFQSFGYNGTMTLWYANGSFQGTYRADSGGSTTVRVTGGRDGTKVWLDIATLGGLRVSGHVDKGVITALGSALSGNQQYVLTATPELTNDTQGDHAYASSSSTRG